MLRHITHLDPDYPRRLRAAPRPPPFVTLSGGPIDATHAVAIVGSRAATAGAASFAYRLARALAERGVVVVSGGALGIDAAAHHGALDAGGRTWVVAGTGHEHCFPRDHGGLFARVARGPGAMIWPFPPQRSAWARPSPFPKRNVWLVGMADAVVVVQAALKSGALNAARCAQSQGKPLWAVPSLPWGEDDYAGTRDLLDGGYARPLTTLGALLASLGLAEDRHPPLPARARPPRHRSSSKISPSWRRPLGAPPLRSGPTVLSDHEFAVLQATSAGPIHADVLTLKVGLSSQATAAALLTLALENVVVEGPPGFFRRRDTPNR